MSLRDTCFHVPREAERQNSWALGRGTFNLQETIRLSSKVTTLLTPQQGWGRPACWLATPASVHRSAGHRFSEVAVQIFRPSFKQFFLLVGF